MSSLGIAHWTDMLPETIWSLERMIWSSFAIVLTLAWVCTGVVLPGVPGHSRPAQHAANHPELPGHPEGHPCT